MKKFINKFNVFISIVLIIFVYATVQGVYQPMNKELKATTRENFVLQAQANHGILNQYIERSLEAANGISSRSMIREKIIEYQEGVTSFEELQAYPKPKFMQGIEALYDVEGAVRTVEGRRVVDYGDVKEQAYASLLSDRADYRIGGEEENPMLIVVSPVMENGEVLGHDIIQFQLTHILEKINQGRILFILHQTGEDETVHAQGETHRVFDEVLADDGFYTQFTIPIDDYGAHLYTRIDNSVLYSKVDQVTSDNLLRLILLMVSMFIITNAVILTSANKLVQKKEKTAEKYKTIASKDPLTGAFTRLHFDQWMKEYAQKGGNEEASEEVKPVVVVLVDLDDFKEINDTYGHEMGDKALRYVYEIFNDTLRQEDFVVRYGGDEFLIVLNECEEECGKMILERIRERMVKYNVLPFSLSLSYGIAEVRQPDEIYGAIKIADEKMYEMKGRRKKK
ncbi:MAG TPA: hypothetical protein DHN33_06765 [Eubacteriaceae bacterium]|nr:hypothetical protein [Eubacteriaceae bacterium]